MGTTPRVRQHAFGVSAQSDTVSIAQRNQSLAVPFHDSRWCRLREREEQMARCTLETPHRRFVNPAREPRVCNRFGP